MQEVAKRLTDIQEEKKKIWHVKMEQHKKNVALVTLWCCEGSFCVPENQSLQPIFWDFFVKWWQNRHGVCKDLIR